MGVPQQAAQRYYNKGTGRMEALVHGKFPGAPSHVPGAPGAHNVSKTTSTTTRTTPVFNPSTVADWTRLNGPQLRQFAEYLVGQDTKGAQAPFQQANQRLGGEQQRTQQAIGQAGQGVLSSIQGTQAKQAQAVQGFASQGAQIAAQGKASVEQAYKGYEGGALTPEVQAQRAADLARQATQSQAAQTGANTRQQELSAWLANSAATAPQRTQQQEGAVASQYGKLKAGNSEKEAALIAAQPGNVQKLWLQLTGQKTALDEARSKLGLQAVESRSKQEERVVKGQTGIANAQSKAQQVKNQGENYRNQAAYRNASLADKERKTNADIKYKASKVTATGPNGKPLTPAQGEKIKGGIGGAFVTFAKMREAGVDWGKIRNAITQGYAAKQRQVQSASGKVSTKAYNEKVTRVQDQTLITAAEQLYRYHHVDAPTRKQLEVKFKAQLGSDAELYEAMTGQQYTPPKPYNTSGNNRHY